MLSRNLRKISNQACKTFTTGQRSYSSFDREFDNLFSLMTRGFERNLYRRPSSFDFFRQSPSVFYEPTVYYSQPVHSTYEQKMITRDETGKVVVKTQRKVPGRPWETYVEEYVNDNKLEQNKKPEAIGQSSETANTKTAEQQEPQQQEQQQAIDKSTPEVNKTTEAAPATPAEQKAKNQTISTQSNHVNALSPFDQHFQLLSNNFFRDFDDFFGRRHPFSSTSRWFEPEMEMLDADSIGGATTYHAETVINDNGRVTVKTVSKKPGSAWETTVKHYGKDGVLEEGQKKTEAIGDNSKSEQKASENAEPSVDSKQKSSENSEPSADSKQKSNADEAVSQ